jgi:RimJ/RimL family protein N-acetyltransferase
MVAAEGKWIGGEAPVDRAMMRPRFVERFARADGRAAMLLAETDRELVGHLGITTERGVADIGMAVAVDWRGQGVGSALMVAAVSWAGEAHAHKVVLQVWPHNHSAQALYRKFGFMDEGRLVRHYRRRNGELWDAVIMALVLDTTSPGSPFDETSSEPS